MQAEGTQVEQPESLSEEEKLRQKLRYEFKTLKNQSKVMVCPGILNSDIYKGLCNRLQNNKSIPERSKIWSRLEDLILSKSPHFKEQLNLLMGKLKQTDYHAILLIKCGFTHSQMAILLGRSKGTITYRRNHIAELIMGE